MPRVLITGFCTLPGPDRAGVQLRHVLRALSPAHTVDVLVVRDADQAYVERQGAARILRVPVPAEAPLRDQVEAFRRALRRQLDGADYDIVHFRDGWSGIPVLELRERLRFAAIFDAARATVATSADAETAAELARDEEACLLASELVLVPTEAARRHAVMRGRPERVLLSPPGVDVDRFDWDDEPPPGTRPRILCAGTMEPGRGVRVLLRAMVDLVRVSDAVLTLAGPIAPGFDATLRHAISELGLQGRVELLGAIEHERMPSLLASATVCVAPAAPELAPRVTTMFPTKLLEYLACRRAVVAPSRGTVNAMLRHNVEALLFAPGDPVDLARKLARLLGDEALRRRLADAGYELVRRDHTASASRRAIRRAYAELASRSPWRERFAERSASTSGSYKLPPGPPEGWRAVTDSDNFEATFADDEATEFDGLGADPDVTGEQIAVVSDVTDGSDPSGRVEHVTEERTLALPDKHRTRDSGHWTRGGSLGAADDDWVVSDANGLRRPWTDSDGVEDDGTPLDVVPAPAAEATDSRFLAGEIDVPTPPPEAIERDGAFTAVGILLGPPGDDPPSRR